MSERVKIVRDQGNFNLAGPIDVITPTHEPEFESYRLPPAKTRERSALPSLSVSSRTTTRSSGTSPGLTCG